MGKRHPNYRLVKIHRNYSVEEITILFSVHKHTVRHWIKAGLPTIDKMRPMLILGYDLRGFLQARRNKNKTTLKPGEFYCVRCRLPKLPAGGFAEFSPITEKIGNLIAICPDCDAIMNRRVSMAKISQVCGPIDISFPEAIEQVIDRDNPTVNSDLR